jgi:hypothetical protein
MKKKVLVHILTILVLCMLLSVSNQGLAKGAEKTSTMVSGNADTFALTMDKASEANSIAHLLEKYKTVTYAQLDYIGGDTIHATYFKGEDGICCTEDDFGYSGYCTDSMVFSRKKGVSSFHLLATKDPYISNYMFVVPGGTFTTQTTNTSGNLVCEAEADISQEYADQLSESWPVTTKDKMITSTVFAADDFRVLSIDFSIRHPDGSELRIASGVLLYNQKVSYTDAVKDYLNNKKLTVTVKMEDGSYRTVQIPKGMTFTWECDDGYALYRDKKGKTPLKEKAGSVKSDLTLYCLPEK